MSVAGGYSYVMESAEVYFVLNSTIKATKPLNLSVRLCGFLLLFQSGLIYSICHSSRDGRTMP